MIPVGFNFADALDRKNAARFRVFGTDVIYRAAGQSDLALRVVFAQDLQEPDRPGSVVAAEIQVPSLSAPPQFKAQIINGADIYSITEITLPEPRSWVVQLRKL